jgi:hypothetical protein
MPVKFGACLSNLVHACQIWCMPVKFGAKTIGTWQEMHATAAFHR